MLILADTMNYVQLWSNIEPMFAIMKTMETTNEIQNVIWVDRQPTTQQAAENLHKLAQTDSKKKYNG